MKTLKLVSQDECRRVQQAPATLREVKQEVKELWRGVDMYVLSPAGNRMCSEAEYRDLLSRTLPGSSLRLTLALRRPAPCLPLLPQCSLCLRFLTSADEPYLLPCRHLYCFACLQNRSLVPGSVVCSVDKFTGTATRSDKVLSLIVGLEALMEQEGTDQVSLSRKSEEIFAEVNTSLVACGYLKDGECPSTSVCKYDHTARAKALARTIGDKQASLEAGKKEEERQVWGLPAQEGEEKKSVVEVPAKPLLPVQRVELEQIDMMESVYIGEKEPVPLVQPQHLLSHLQQSLQTSLHSMRSLRLSQLRVFAVTCSICGVNPILGCVYPCTHCALVLCPACEQRSDHPHPLYKIQRPELMQAKVKASAPVPAAVILDRSISERKLAGNDLESRLAAMGFNDRDAVQSALKASRNDLDEAVVVLLSSPSQVR